MTVCARGPRPSRHLLIVLLATLCLATAVSAVHPHDAFTWWLEAGPVLVAVPLLLATYRCFSLTNVSYVAIWVHALVLVLGAHHTWLFFLVVCFCLAFSAFYEMVEWWVAISAEDGDAVAFLATQGDVWDTQWDMFLALCGAVVAQLALARVQDRQLAP